VVIETEPLFTKYEYINSLGLSFECISVYKGRSDDLRILQSKPKQAQTERLYSPAESERAVPVVDRDEQ
jgi:hypothetical protein